MLIFMVLLMTLTYLLTLLVLRLWQKSAQTAPPNHNVLFILKREVAEKNLEWLLYSFNSFASKNLKNSCIDLYVAQTDPERQKSLTALCGRFHFQLITQPPKIKEYALVFYGGNTTVSNYWQNELNQCLPKAN